MKRYLMIFAACLLMTSSCGDWLDLKPYDGVVEDDYWQTKEDVRAVVVGCYESLLNKDLVASLIYWGEARADLITAPAVGANTNMLNIVRGEITPENTIVKWDPFYTSINACNKVIEKASMVRERDKTFSDELYHQYVAEATAIRSLLYFYLVRSFKEVPLVLTASNSDDQNYDIPKSDENTILDRISLDLDSILNENYLPASYAKPEYNSGYITRWMVMALRADIALWRGDYQKCSDLCSRIIGSGRFSLIPVNRTVVPVYDNVTGLVRDTVYYPNSGDAEKWFTAVYVTGNSAESIFELQYPKTHESLGDPFFEIFNSTSSRPKVIANTAVLDEVIFPPYEEDVNVRDIRSFTYQGQWVFKWTATNLSGTSRRERQFPHWIIYRISDAILMKAEALNQMAMPSNDSIMLEEAYALVKQIRERANALDDADSRLTSPIDGKALEKLLLAERAREFVFEGKRWYDVLRYAKRNNYADNNRDYLKQMAVNSAPPEKVSSLQVKYDNNWFHYWPIYYSAVEVNKNLVQNEFYQMNQ